MTSLNDPHVKRCRVEAIRNAPATIERFVDRLQQCASATFLLHQWCSELKGRACPPVEARQVHRSDEQVPVVVKNGLNLKPGEDAAHRSARLAIGNRVLSTTNLYFAPARLPAEIRYRLATTGLPFGQIIGSLAPARLPLRTKRLWSQALSDDRLPPWLIEHHAIVTVDGIPIARVCEVYSRNIVDFRDTAVI